MSYLIQEPSNFINIKLTDTGRRLLSMGALTFDKIILSDREINYNLGRGNYDLCRNRIITPKDDQPNYNYSLNSTLVSFDNSAPTPITSQNLTGAKQIVTAITNSIGFFSAVSGNYMIKTVSDPKPLGIATIDYSLSIPSGGTEINISAGGYSANTGDLVYIAWEPPQYSGITNNTNYIYSGQANLNLWYRIQGSTGLTISLDRNTPNFGTNPIVGSNQKIQAYFYPYGQVEKTYGSASTTYCGVWNMNIVRTTSEIGTTPLMSGYTTYGSIEYNGTKQYLGFDNDTKYFGILHYTNKFSGNSYAEQFVPGSVILNIPNIMWHNVTSTTLGKEMSFGVNLYDAYDSDIFDTTAQTYYRPLRDGVMSTSNIVGRVYHKLKMIIITDQEMLTALTYKSNRNYTLPNINAYLMPSNSVSNATGLCKSNYSYYVTYLTSSKPYQNGVSYGYPQGLPCGYITKIDGQTDSLGYPSVLALNFPAFSFPYMRNSSDLTALSGTGWNANSVQILLQEVATSASTLVGDLPTNKWRLISNGYGNGMFTGDTINPQSLQSHIFLISQQDYDSGTTYSLSGQYSAFTSNNDSVSQSGLTFGNENFFYGNLTTGIQANVYKTVITVFAKNDEYNSSLQNSTYNGLYDANTFISEIGILNSNNDLVGVAKPSYPLKKNNSRYLAFQLELDF